MATDFGEVLVLISSDAWTGIVIDGQTEERLHIEQGLVVWLDQAGQRRVGQILEVAPFFRSLNGVEIEAEDELDRLHIDGVHGQEPRRRFQPCWCRA